MRSSTKEAIGRARPPGAPGQPQRKNLPQDRRLWLGPEDEIFFIAVCCTPRGNNQLCRRKHCRRDFRFSRILKLKRTLVRAPYFWQAGPRKRDASREGAALHGGAPGGRALLLLLALAILGLASCRTDMNNQPRTKPLSQSDFFSNDTSARPLPPHVVPYRDARQDVAFYTGMDNGVYITRLPMKLTPELLARGRERFDAICAECHDRTGSGNGMVVQRGFPQPPSYHAPRLRDAPIGHFYDVITNGYGVMYSYATRVEPEDRWAIAAYIRALQLSHHATVSDVPPDERATMEASK